MDYARQNYVAQPGDGLKPKDFIRRVGPFDDFVINWGYRILPNASSPRSRAHDAQRLVRAPERTVRLPLRAAAGRHVDPRSQTEDIGDDPVKASDYALMNCKSMSRSSSPGRRSPATTTPTSTRSTARRSACGRSTWATSPPTIGGVNVDLKTADQGAQRLPRRAEGEAEGGVGVPEYQCHQRRRRGSSRSDIASRTRSVEPRHAPGGDAHEPARAGAPRPLLRVGARSIRRTRIRSPSILGDLKTDVFAGAAPDANRRMLQRVYVERLAAIDRTARAADRRRRPRRRGAGAQAFTPPPFMAQPNVPRSDLPALARAAAPPDSRRSTAQCHGGERVSGESALAGPQRSRRRRARSEEAVARRRETDALLGDILADDLVQPIARHQRRDIPRRLLAADEHQQLLALLRREPVQVEVIPRNLDAKLPTVGTRHVDDVRVLRESHLGNSVAAEPAGGLGVGIRTAGHRLNLTQIPRRAA